jgi:hypothetical protein
MVLTKRADGVQILAFLQFPTIVLLFELTKRGGTLLAW